MTYTFLGGRIRAPLPGVPRLSLQLAAGVTTMSRCNLAKANTDTLSRFGLREIPIPICRPSMTGRHSAKSTHVGIESRTGSLIEDGFGKASSSPCFSMWKDGVGHGWEMQVCSYHDQHYQVHVVVGRGRWISAYRLQVYRQATTFTNPFQFRASARSLGGGGCMELGNNEMKDWRQWLRNLQDRAATALRCTPARRKVGSDIRTRKRPWGPR